MLITFGVIAMLGTMVSAAWLVVSLLKYLFSRGSPAATKNLKRSGSALAVCFVAFVVFAISLPGTTQSSSPVRVTEQNEEPVQADQEAAEADADVEVDQNVEGAEVVEVPLSPPVPDPKPDNTPDVTPEEPEFERLSRSQEFVWIRNNQRLLKQKLKDPDSAKFGDDYVSYKSGGPVVCGTVNARNSFGGYSGAERYVGMGAELGVYMASEVSDFDTLWRRVC